MRILIDATWVGEIYGLNVMHGGFRVTNELLKRLPLFPQHQFYLTNTNFQSSAVKNIERFVADNDLSSNVGVHARTLSMLDDEFGRKIFSKLSNKIPIPTLVNFVKSDMLNNADVYHSPVNLIPGVIRRKKKVRKFFTALDLIPLVRPDLSNIFYDYTRSLYDTLTMDTNVLAISESTKRDLLKYRPELNPEKIRVIYLAADKRLFYSKTDAVSADSILAKYQLGGVPYFLTVNSMAKYKNVEFVLDGFMKFHAMSGDPNVKLLVVGQNRDSSYIDYIRKKYGSTEFIILLDYIKDESLVDLYNGATGFLYMSKYEGFGLPILEAMQCGTPVVCSNTSSMPEVAGDAAITMDPDDEVEFVKSLMSLYNSRSVRENLRSAGLVQSSRFSWEKYATEVVKAYEEMR